MTTPTDLTNEGLPSPGGEVANLSLPKFQTRAELDAWVNRQLFDLISKMKLTREQAALLIDAAEHYNAVRAANAHLRGEG